MPCKQRNTPFRIELTAEDEKRFRDIDTIFLRLLGGCSEDEFMAIRCPVCGEALILRVHPSLHYFFVRCTSDSTHLGRTEEMDRPPAWWHSHVTTGWYGDELEA